MLDWLKKNQINKLSEPVISDQDAQIRVIGDRSSGKTAYMASLAYWPNANADSPVQSVTPFGDQEAGAELIARAQNILEQGLRLEQTDLNPSVNDVKDYGLSIILKSQFYFKNPRAGIQTKMVKLNITCKDYSGEFFSDLIHKVGDSILENYIQDCLQAKGILFLVDGTTHGKDSEYAKGLDKFLMALAQTDIGGNKRRLALVLTKCELSELWVSRHEPRDLTQKRFRQVYRTLQAWQQVGTGSVDYFTTSAFGMLGSRFPESNSKKITRDRNGTMSVIRDPKHWRPFGLVSPIYWLCTGERHKELDKD